LRTFSLFRFTARWYGYRVHGHFQRCPRPLDRQDLSGGICNVKTQLYPVLH
jgi:hypothetical protein